MTKFENGMEITVTNHLGQKYIRTLKRWQKYGYDRLYICDGGRSENYINLKNMELECRPASRYVWSKLILEEVKKMEF